MALKNFYVSFGCKVNQYETQNISEQFSLDGCEKVNNIKEADVCIINSCTVTAQADSKLRHFIKRVHRENPSCLIVLTGCFPQAFPQKAQDFSECKIICGSRDKNKLREMVYNALESENLHQTICISEQKLNGKLEPMCNCADSGKTRAYIKIQDGCDMACSYCIIPTARGHICSKSIEDIKCETELLLKANHKEIILTGINLCCYGKDFKNGTRLVDALEAVCSIDGNFRVRLSSMEPEMISDEDILRMTALNKLCPQFHLSLQSGCNKTLKAMNRHYSAQQYQELCVKLREAFDGCAITTDIMVGFPNETDEDFNESLEFVKKTSFSAAHIFPYSRRTGTKADKLDGQIDKNTKTKRAAKMREICKNSQLEYNRSFIGKTAKVLFEREVCAEYHQGHIPEYVLVKVERTDNSTLFRQFKQVKIIDANENFCTGELI